MNTSPKDKNVNPATKGMTKEEKKQHVEELKAFFNEHRKQDPNKSRAVGIIPKPQEIEEREYCGRDLNEMNISKKIVIIRREAFMNCKRLKRIVFNDDSRIETIEASAFRGCPQLKEIIFPKKVINVYGVDVDFNTLSKEKEVELIKLLTAPVPKEKKRKKPRVHTKARISRSNAASPNDAKGRHYSWYRPK